MIRINFISVMNMEEKNVEKELRDKISKFSGNILSCYSMTRELHKEFKFDLDINFDSTNSVQRFTNMVRNMVSRKLIEKPTKLGRNLIFDERSFLQLIVARKYLSSGSNMESLSGFLEGKSNDELYERLFANQLSDFEEVTKSRFSKASVEKALSAQEVFPLGDNVLLRQFKIKAGLFLQVREGMLSQNELSDMVHMLKEYLENRTRPDTEQEVTDTDDN